LARDSSACPRSAPDSESPEEAAEVAAVARSIVEGGSTWVNEDGDRLPVTWEEVLIVAPYNAQVGAIKRLLPPAARVGTVDKFQGQEAPISIYSLTTSSPELAPRGMDFLYSRNRLNVATSSRQVHRDRLQHRRTCCASGRERRPRCGSRNAFCRYSEMGDGDHGRPVCDPTPLQVRQRSASS
jgi:uncharacterized protein